MERINVKDKLPKPLKDVFYTFNNGRYGPKIVDRAWMSYDGSWPYKELYGKVTNWMPMPEPAEDD